ncbi:MAG: DUF5330 domain-containing protein [Rhodobiaceae bacterium]|nr:DUF5330 domain-containing protein [Rhodobiaceae bacterium]MCC0016615.1 DUF5330 domain-containing protein [Rhodobiaceae bacterium]MCC0042266.1 DUF5330 domain-containing protein [Rhodobiaceae bacterium]
MFFLLRTVFWLSLVVLLLPAGNGERGGEAAVSTGEAIYAAQTFVSDMSGFCARNPDACATGQAALKSFGAKAQYGAKLVYGYLGDLTGEHADIEVQNGGRSVATTRVQIVPQDDGAVAHFYPPPGASAPQGGPAPSAVATQTGSVNAIGSLIRQSANQY